jgi:hypothetical protein
MRPTIIISVVVSLMALALSVPAQTPRFQITAFTDRGGGVSVGGPFSVYGTIGQSDIGQGGGGQFAISGGFWPGFSGAGTLSFKATYVVTTTDDSGPGSLRQAILDANATEEPDQIQFDIPGAGMQTIAPSSPLPTITAPVMIDGYSQPGASANTLTTGNDATLLIELSGQNAGAGAHGLVVYTSNCVVRGLVINQFEQNGIYVLDGDRNTLAGNFIGVDPTGSLARSNGVNGIYLVRGSHNIIGGSSPSDRNVISANNETGVFITDLPGISNRIEGNYIGVNAAGTAALGNAVYGVRVNYSSGKHHWRRAAWRRQCHLRQRLSLGRRRHRRLVRVSDGQSHPGQPCRDRCDRHLSRSEHWWHRVTASRGGHRHWRNHPVSQKYYFRQRGLGDRHIPFRLSDHSRQLYRN